MKAKPLGNYAAVEPITRDTFEGSSILMSTINKHERWLHGRVLALGSRVESDVKVGDEVVYEAQSAHPKQNAALDAGMFGGTEGGQCFLIPVLTGSLRSAASLDREVALRKKEMQRLESLGDTRFLNDEEASEYGRHERRVQELTDRRRELARGPQWDPWKTPGRGAGIVGIVEETQNGKE